MRQTCRHAWACLAVRRSCTRPPHGRRDVLVRGLIAALLGAVAWSVHPAQVVNAQTAVYLNAPNVKQDKALDCEAASLQIALAVAGYNVSQDTIFNRLPQDGRAAVVAKGSAKQWGDPYAAFVGNVNGAEANFTGYGVYFPPIANVAIGVGAAADGHAGWTVPDIEAQIRRGSSVIVWVNYNYTATGVRYWTAWDGRSIPYTTYEHTLVAIGFDSVAQTITSIDVRTGTRVTFSESAYASVLTTFGGMGVAVSPPFHGATIGSHVSNGHPAGLVAINERNVYVMPSTGTAFSPPSVWSGSALFGRRATVAADVNGDGSADLVAVNDASTWVMTSNGSQFGAPKPWSSTPFYGSIDTIATDVTGDGKADLIAINDHSVYVMPSTGTRFSSPVRWSGAQFYGSVATMAADVNGDGRADLVAINAGNVYVMLSTGSGFAAPKLWSSAPFYGSIDTVAADVTGDGRAELLAVNGNSVYVMLSTGASFSPPTQWSTAPFYGSRATIVADVSGDNKADVVAVNDSSTWVMTAGVSGFNAPAVWSGTPFYGTEKWHRSTRGQWVP
ncbi:MAG: FG-GAP-like repeat-containing protein [Candidatus Dormibacter sp.]